MTKPPDYVPHQLHVHLDQHPNGDLEIRYDYPFSGHHPLPEQIVRIAASQVPEQLRTDLDEVRTLARNRIEVKPVRIPHGEVLPKLEDGILTVVTRDRQRPLPIVRLYCIEAAPELDSRFERQGRLEGNEFPAERREVWNRIKQTINGIAWANFQTKVSPSPE